MAPWSAALMYFQELLAQYTVLFTIGVWRHSIAWTAIEARFVDIRFGLTLSIAAEQGQFESALLCSVKAGQNSDRVRVPSISFSPTLTLTT